MITPTAIKTYIEWLNGEAVIVGRGNLKAEYVARRHVHGGDTVEQVMEHYNLSRAEVHAALAYYYENQQILDDAYEKVFSEKHPNVIDSKELEARIRARMKPVQDA